MNINGVESWKYDDQISTRSHLISSHLARDRSGDVTPSILVRLNVIAALAIGGLVR